MSPPNCIQVLCTENLHLPLLLFYHSLPLPHPSFAGSILSLPALFLGIQDGRRGLKGRKVMGMGAGGQSLPSPALQTCSPGERKPGPIRAEPVLTPSGAHSISHWLPRVGVNLPTLSRCLPGLRANPLPGLACWRRPLPGLLELLRL